MAKYQTKQFLNTSPLYTPDNAEICGSPITVEFPTTALVANDLIELATIPAGIKVVDYKILFPDIDSGGSPAFAFSIGVENAGGTDLGAEGTAQYFWEASELERAIATAIAEGSVG